MSVLLTFNADPIDGYDVLERLFLAPGRSVPFSGLVIDGPGGLLANMDVATDALGRSATRIVLTYWPGIIDPRIAARQLGFLQTASAGRLSLRFLLEEQVSLDERRQARRHVTAVRELGAHIEALKATWKSLETSLQFGRKPSRPSLRMKGATGAALRLAARHADVFELPAGDLALVAAVIERLDAARTQLGRRDRIRYALPIRLARHPDRAEGELLVTGDTLVYRGPLMKLAAAVEPYLSMGIDEIMIGGPTSSEEIDRFEFEAAPALLEPVRVRPQYNSDAIARTRSELPSTPAVRAFRGH